MIMRVFLIAIVGLCSVAQANPPTALVEKLRGEVTFLGNPIKKGDGLTQEGDLVTGKDSFVKIFIAKWKNSIIIGPNSSMKLELSNPDAKTKYKFSKGICRWISRETNSKLHEQGKLQIRTDSASIGIRGTDFLLKFNSILGETEIVVLDGQVHFQSESDPQDTALISKGQWGGIGGRFGSKIGQIIDLPSMAVDGFSRQLKW